MDPIHLLGRVIYEPPLYSVLVAVQCSVAQAIVRVELCQRLEAWCKEKCEMSSGSVCMESAVRTHVKIMQSTCGLAAPAPAGPRPSTAAVSPDLRSPIVAWPWSADSYCQFTSLLWLTFTSAVTPYEWHGDTEVRSSDICFIDDSKWWLKKAVTVRGETPEH